MSVVLVVLAGFIAILLWIKLPSKKTPPLPPGPPAEPFIGHLRVIPSEYQEETFIKWGKIYGDVIHLRVPRRSIIVLNSERAAIDLLEERSQNYSDRMKFVILELMGWVPTLPFLRYGEQFKTHRKMMQHHLRPQNISTIQPIQCQEACGLVQALLCNPGSHDEALERFVSSVVIRVAYGHQITSDNDPYLQIAHDVGYALNNIGSVGNTPAEFFPFLQYFPSWFPGAYYVGHARRCREAIRRLHDFPYEMVKKEMAEGTAEPSFLADQLDDANGRKSDSEIFDIKGVAGAIYAGGTDTTTSTLLIFLLAMVLHPACQVAAQKELDVIIGAGRLPDFSDRESLPYIDCILQETLRWNTVIPLGIPHRSMEDDVYKGMFIPKGSIIIANTKAMAFDESVYANPHEFRPSRFLPKPVGDGAPPFQAAFGFGRRVCPGRYLADANLWVAMATILMTLDISKAMGEDGKEITPDIAFTSGLVNRVKRFKCSIHPRSPAAQSLIAQGIAE